MKRFFCYPLYAIFIPLFGFAISLATFFLFCYSIHLTLFELILAIILFSVPILFSAGLTLWNIQWVKVKNDSIVLRNPFITMETINKKEMFVDIRDLWTFANHTASKQKWICIYSNLDVEKFKNGCTNLIHKNRIQLIYSEKALSTIGIDNNDK